MIFSRGVSVFTTIINLLSRRKNHDAGAEANLEPVTMSQHPVKIYRQKRRTMMMRVVPGGVEVFIPHTLKANSKVVREFIKDGLTKLDGHMLPVPAEQSSTDDILTMVDQWARRVGVKPKRVQFREMRRKWGSCSSRSTVTLNTSLCWLPPHLAEYVVCHELVHLRELNHGPAFQALMSEHLPDWRERERELAAVRFSK